MTLGRQSCDHQFVSIKGGSYANFQRALDSGNLTMIRAAATELPAINLDGALTICVLVSEQRPEHSNAPPFDGWGATRSKGRTRRLRDFARRPTPLAGSTVTAQHP